MIKTMKCFSLAIFLLANSASAQLDTFDLSLFKQPDITRHQLDFFIDLSADTRHDRTFRDDPDENRGGLRHNLFADFDAHYSFYRNSRPYQGFHTISLGNNGNYRNWKDLVERDDHNGNTSADNFLRINSTNRFYVWKLFFYELDPTIYYGHNIRNYQNQWGTDLGPLRTEGRDINHRGILEIPFGVGYGRIEEVTDARLAVYVLDDLMSHNKLSRSPSTEEVLLLAKRMSEIKNRRFFDARLQRIREIKTVDSLIQSTVPVTDADAVYFTTLYDNWDFAAWPPRFAGGRLSFRIQPRTDLYFSNRFMTNYYVDNDSLVLESLRKQESGRFAITGLGRYEYHRPLNLKWQFSGFADLGYEWVQEDDQLQIIANPFRLNDEEVIFSKINGKIGFYPNSRTSISLGLTGSYWNYVRLNRVVGMNDLINKRWELASDLQVNYYISPRVRLNGRYAWRYDRFTVRSEPEAAPTDSRERLIYQEIEVGFLYSLF